MADGAAPPPKEAIVVVHGTFSAATTDAPKWWQPDARDSFVAKLDAALERRSAPVRCWANCSETSPVFQWTGHNHWVDRTRAAAELVRYLSELGKEGWTCHLVGHSHGGNVIVDALHGLKGTSTEAVVRSVTTLGTPFLDTVSAIEKQRNRTSWLVQLSALLALMLGVGVACWYYPYRANFKDIGIYVVGAAIWILGWLLVGFVRHLRTLRRAVPKSTPALAINSRYDEAWQLLHHVRETTNPLAVREGLIPYLGRRIRDYVRRRSDIARIYGATSVSDLRGHTKTIHLILFAAVFLGPLDVIHYQQGFLLAAVVQIVQAYATILFFIALFTLGSKAHISAFLWPLRYFGFLLASPKILPGEIGTYVARRNSWDLLQRLVLGLDGFRFELPRVRQVPEQSGSLQFTFESLSKDAETRALAARASWMERNLGLASEAFSKLILSAADVSELLRTLEKDQSLVHAAYYVDDECIERIADWICAKQPQMATSAIAAA